MNVSIPPAPRRLLALALTGTLVGAAVGCAAPRGARQIETPASTAGASTQPSAESSPEDALRQAKTLEARAYETKNPEDFRAAAAALEEALSHSPDDIALRKSLGYLYLDPLKDPGRAYPHLARVADALPEEVGWVQMAARAASESNRPGEAIALYRGIVGRDPANVWDRLTLAKILIARKRDRDAETLLREALKVEPRNEYVNLAYAGLLMARGERERPERIAVRVLESNPQSPGAHSILGDLRRTAGDFTGASTAYGRALESDPGYYSAREGLRQIAGARAPRLATAFYYFEDTEGLRQAGLFNTAAVYLANRLYADVAFNALRFSNEDEGVGAVHRLEEGLGLEYRFAKELAARAGVSAFQIEGAEDQAGFNASVTWTPNPVVWGFTQYRENDPVNDSIYTVVEGFTQDVFGGGAGVVFTPRLWSSVAASTAGYSDGNHRRYLKGDLSHLLLTDPEAYLRLEYELIDYDRPDPGYSSPQNYDYVRPVVEVEPRLTKRLSLHARFEVPYVVDEAAWGTGVTVGPVLKWGEDLQLRAIYMRYDLPGDFAPYTGDGFKISFVYRF